MSARHSRPLRLVSRVGDVLTVEGGDRWETHDVRYVGWGRAAPEHDPAANLSDEDTDALVQSWAARGGGGSRHFHAVVTAQLQGRKIVEGRPVPGCTCPSCAPRRSPPPQAAPRLSEVAIEHARTVAIMDVAAALGIGGLRRMGKTLRAPCPLHDGEGLNFALIPATNGFKCFSCGAAGDGIGLVRAMRGCGFIDAVVFLAGV